MDRKKPLCLPRGFEPAHLAFAVACRLMRDLGAIIQASTLAVGDAGQELSAGSAIAAKPIGYDQTGNIV